MSNIYNNISRHNQQLYGAKIKDETRRCNCRNPSDCPLNGECLTANIIYQATVTTTDSAETYIGQSSSTFKLRYGNHKASFNNSNKQNATELSKYIWSLKHKNIAYTTTWKIIKKTVAYSNITKICHMCIWEKLFIIYHPTMASLNKRSELMSSCRHTHKFLLRNC